MCCQKLTKYKNAIQESRHDTHPHHSHYHSTFPSLPSRVALALHEAAQLLEGHAARLGHEPEVRSSRRATPPRGDARRARSRVEDARRAELLDEQREGGGDERVVHHQMLIGWHVCGAKDGCWTTSFTNHRT